MRAKATVTLRNDVGETVYPVGTQDLDEPMYVTVKVGETEVIVKIEQDDG